MFVPHRDKRSNSFNSRPTVPSSDLCQQYLRGWYPDSNIHHLKEFTSYMTGLIHHGNYKPVENEIYQCVPEPENKFDSCAIGIYHGQVGRIAYIPKQISAEVYEMFKKHQNPVIMLCFCLGRTTHRSSQCRYHLFEML